MRCSNAAVALLLVAAMPGAAADERALIDQAERAAAAYATEVRALLDSLPPPDAAMQELARQTVAEAECAQARSGFMPPVPPPAGMPDVPRITVFVSRSLGRQALTEIFDELRHDPHARAVFRGLAPGQSLAEGVTEMMELARPDEAGRVATIEIDPEAFRQHGVSSVPTMLAESASGVVARIEGAASPLYLRRELAGRAAETPLTGRIGALAGISERDLIEQAQARIRALDFDRLRSEALARALGQLASTAPGLQPATEFRRRHIDPTIEMRAPARPGEHHLANFVPPGARINPLDMAPFDQLLVIFDARSQAQREVIQGAAVAHLAAHPGLRVTWIASAVDAEAGWDGFTRVEDALDAPLYLLDARLIARFALERTPALVYAADRRFVVEEWPVAASAD